MKHQQERLKLFSLDVENVGGVERALCTLCRREEPGWAVVKPCVRFAVEDRPHLLLNPKTSPNVLSAPPSPVLQVAKASDEPLEGAKGKKSQKQRLLDELYHKYCIGEGAKSDGQVGAEGRRQGWVLESETTPGLAVVSAACLIAVTEPA